MPLEYAFMEEPEEEGALILPYPPDDEDGRTNTGFRDLRGKPDEARKVSEAEPSSALKALLVALAQPDARYFTIGCDLGAHPNSDGSFGAGGYIQIAFADLNLSALYQGHSTRLSTALEAFLARRVGELNWKVNFILTAVTADALGGPAQIWSPLIEFATRGDTLLDACSSAETLVSALHKFLIVPSA
jgi:hypothetical protein